MSDPSPLSPEQREQLAAAAALRDVVLKPARVARVNGWSVGIFGVLSVLIGLVSGGGGIVIGVALVAIAWNEMRGVARLRALDPEGARILAWNQLVLGGVVVVYCANAIVQARLAPNPSMKELEDVAGIAPSLLSDLTAFFYGSVAIVVIIAQGLFARYHFRAEARVRAFLADTPPWVRELLTATTTAG